MKTIITGATGMVGEGVLLECLENPAVKQVLVINRRRGGVSHPKLREIIHRDFFDLSPIAPQLNGYNACFFCLGVSSIGLTEEEYKRTTYDLTMHVAELLAKLNPDLTFCYVSGLGTGGKAMWARVKSATENALMQLFKKSYMFRPGFMKATRGQKNVNRYYKYVAWLYPIARLLYPSGISTLQEVARAMINVATTGYPKQILEVKDIKVLSAES